MKPAFSEESMPCIEISVLRAQILGGDTQVILGSILQKSGRCALNQVSSILNTAGYRITIGILGPHVVILSNSQVYILIEVVEDIWLGVSQRVVKPDAEIKVIISQIVDCLIYCKVMLQQRSLYCIFLIENSLTLSSEIRNNDNSS